MNFEQTWNTETLLWVLQNSAFIVKFIFDPYRLYLPSKTENIFVELEIVSTEGNPPIILRVISLISLL